MKASIWTFLFGNLFLLFSVCFPSIQAQMTLGLVSSCFQSLRSNNSSLEDLLSQAYSHGIRYVELRQSQIGQPYETGPNYIPVPHELSALVAKFPLIEFNLAISLPFLSGNVSTSDEVFQAALKATKLMGGKKHLRMVDLKTTSATLDVHRAVRNLHRMVDLLSAIGGKLSFENALQNWTAVSHILQSVNGLHLCYDPCNFYLSPHHPDPANVTASLLGSEIVLLHMKQAIQGAVQPFVGDGQLDWRTQFNYLNMIGYRGPALFEVKADVNLWANLNQSLQYISRMGFNTV